MQWKMAPNSLFAILLRSPWWVSMLVVLAIASAARVLLPAQYMLFGVVASLPFLIIGMVAAFRQFQVPGAAQVQRTLETAGAMAWRDFALALEQAYTDDGYTVSRMEGRSADLLLTKAGRQTLVAARRWKAGNHGVEPLRHLQQECQALDASASVYVTLSAPSDKVRTFATNQKIQLMHGASLAQLLRTTTVARR